MKTKDKPKVKRILDRIAWGLSGVEEARLLGELLDSLDDQIKALKLKIKTLEEGKIVSNYMRLKCVKCSALMPSHICSDYFYAEETDRVIHYLKHYANVLHAIVLIRKNNPKYPIVIQSDSWTITGSDPSIPYFIGMHYGHTLALETESGKEIRRFYIKNCSKNTLPRSEYEEVELQKK